MTSDLELAHLFNAVTSRVSEAKVAPVAAAEGWGYIELYDAVARSTSLRKGSRDASPTSGFKVPAWMNPAPGDYVRYRELGSDRVILAPFDRNASVDRFSNPLTASGQIIIAGPDGKPTVIEPPADPTLDYTLQWIGADQRPEWVPD